MTTEAKQEKLFIKCCLNKANNLGLTPLMSVVNSHFAGYLDVLKLLLRHLEAEEIVSVDRNNRTAFHYAVDNQDKSPFRLLFQALRSKTRGRLSLEKLFLKDTFSEQTAFQLCKTDDLRDELNLSAFIGFSSYITT